MKRKSFARTWSAGTIAVCAMWLAACEGAVEPSLEQLALSGSEELVSEGQVTDAEALSDRPEYFTDVAATDRVCRVSDATIGAGRGLLGLADDLAARLIGVHTNSVSAARAPVFAQTAEVLYAALQGPSSCREIVRRFIEMTRAGHALGQAIHREHLIRRDDRLGVLVRKTASQYVELLRLLREDLSNQVRPTDARPTDARPTRP